jgi:type IV secretory pathway TraG/TraD family ATPase VirD4
MKREKYYDFLFDWNNVEKGHEFEKKAREYLDFIARDYSETNKPPCYIQKYKQGMLAVLKGAIDTISKFLGYDDPQKDYLVFFLEIKEKYHKMYLLFKKDRALGKAVNIQIEEYVRGQFRAASDLYKGLTHMTQSMIEFQQSNSSSKRISHVTPTLLTKTGNIVVLDFKGENFKEKTQ